MNRGLLAMVVVNPERAAVVADARAEALAAAVRLAKEGNSVRCVIANAERFEEWLLRGENE